MSSQRRIRTLLLLSTALAAGAVASTSASASKSLPHLQPQALVQAKAIRTNVNARYRRLPGRKSAVTEVTSMGVVDSVSLIVDPLEPLHVIPAENGIYFALCTVGTRCPHPPRSAAWDATAFRPRRQALELAVRAFTQTAASLVVVALATWSPTWVVFERDDLGKEVGAALRAQLAADPRFADADFRAAVDELTLARTFVPLGIEEVGPGLETFLAMSLSEGSRK